MEDECFTSEEAVEFMREHGLGSFVTIGGIEYCAITKRGLDLAAKLAGFALQAVVHGQTPVEIVAEQSAESN